MGKIMKEKISIIGVGRLGLTFALLVDEKGYDVCGCDVNEPYIKSLQEKTFVSKEPHVTDLLKQSSIKFTNDTIEALNHSSVIFLFVPTPSLTSGEYNHQYIEQVVAEIENNKITSKTIMIGCTVMPGYCKSLQEKLSKLNIIVIYNPSLISQGEIVNGLKNADIIITGGKIPKVVYDLYVAIMGKTPIFKALSLTGAEIAKISINCFLTTKIAYANRIGEICINSGLWNEVDEILNAIGSDRRIGNEFLKYGFGFSGVCLPRDNRALGLHACEVGISPKLQSYIDAINGEHLKYLYDHFVSKNKNRKLPFIFYQLSYKKGVDILTESQPLRLCLMFLENGFNVNIVESDAVIEMAKDILKPYENQITYSKEMAGIKIEF